MNEYIADHKLTELERVDIYMVQGVRKLLLIIVCVLYRVFMINCAEPIINKHFEPVLVCCGFFLTVR